MLKVLCEDSMHESCKSIWRSWLGTKMLKDDTGSVSIENVMLTMWFCTGLIL